MLLKRAALVLLVLGAYVALPIYVVARLYVMPVPHNGEAAALWAAALFGVTLPALSVRWRHLSRRHPENQRLAALRDSSTAALGILACCAFLVFLTQGLWRQVLLNQAGSAKSTLAGLRQRIEAYRVQHGTWPATLEELGPVPEVAVWATEGPPSWRLHRHLPSRAVQMLSGGPDEVDVTFFHRGTYAIQPSGADAADANRVEASRAALVGDFNGFDPGADSMRKNWPDGGDRWSVDKRLAAGEHEFGFALDGAERSPRQRRDLRAATDGVNHRVHPAGFRDEGGWLYYPASGRVAIACSGEHTSRRRPFSWY